MSLQILTQPGQALNASFDYCQFSRILATLLNNYVACQLSATKKTTAKNNKVILQLSLILLWSPLINVSSSLTKNHWILFNCRLFILMNIFYTRFSAATAMGCHSKPNCMVITKMFRKFRCNWVRLIVFANKLNLIISKEHCIKFS